jgi:hypothetical protein
MLLEVNIWNFAATIVDEEKNFVDVINQEDKDIAMNVMMLLAYQDRQDQQDQPGQLGRLDQRDFKVLVYKE